ncbi:hypothetical protein ACET3X_001081 [Alternaria dauci]|uniref:Ubiquitin-like domain-containing protein n=1 Tax=Alternaria dauci TaxID=48095 RepID=A0ABR3UWL4_9PLEO
MDQSTGACSRIFATGPNGEISLSFRRTSKVPNDGFRGLPSSVREAGGWFIAMQDQEAMFIDFDSNREFAVAVGSATSKKAHCFVNGKYYLDGLPDSAFPDCVRQFLAAPASSRSQNNSDDGTVVGSLLLDIKPSKTVFVVPDKLITFPTFTIDVKTLTGKSFQVGINDVTTGIQLKTAIHDVEGIPPDQQRIIFQRMQITDETVLSSHGIVEGSVVHLVLRLRGGWKRTIARPFASHMMTLKPGGLIWQPKALKEAPQITLAETSTLIPIHILNAKHVQAWTGIDPPQSLVDPELYITAGIPFVQDEDEAEELVKQNATLYDQLNEHAVART